MGLTRKQWVMIILFVVGTFVAILNQTVMTPAVPTIMSEMSVDASTVQWLTTGFTLVNAIMIPVTAFLIDRFSVKGLFAASMAIFAVGSALAGIAPQYAILLIGRLVQAAGAGILSPLAMTVLLRTFPVERRGTAMGLFGLVIAFAPAVGPTVAGAVVDSIGWHFLFYVIAILAAAVCVLILIFMEKGDTARKDVKLDVLSVILSTVGFGAFLYGLSVIGSDGVSIAATVGIVIGAVVLVFFFYRQVAMDEPMLQVRVMTNRRFLISMIIIMLVQASLMGGTVLTPIYIQDDLGFSALQSGLVVLPGAIITGVMSPISGRLFDRYGPRVLGIIGMAITTVGSFLFVLVGDSTTLAYLMVIYTVRMLGMSLVNMPINTWGMNALPNELINHGTSVVNTFRQVAGSFGTAILVSVYSLVMASSTGARGEIGASIYGFNMAFAVSAALAFVGFIITIFFVNNKPPKRDDSESAEDKDEAPLASIMNRTVYSIPEEATVFEAAQGLVNRGINGAPLMNPQGEAVGFISDGDIFRYISRNDAEVTDPNTMITYMLKIGSEEEPLDQMLDELLQMNVMGIATKKVISIDIDTDLVEICRIMTAHRLKKAPVVNDGVVVGIVSRTDILAYALKLYERLQKNTANRIEDAADDAAKLEEAAANASADAGRLEGATADVAADANAAQPNEQDATQARKNTKPTRRK